MLAAIAIGYNGAISGRWKKKTGNKTKMPNRSQENPKEEKEEEEDDESQLYAHLLLVNRVRATALLRYHRICAVRVFRFAHQDR